MVQKVLIAGQEGMVGSAVFNLFKNFQSATGAKIENWTSILEVKFESKFPNHNNY